MNYIAKTTKKDSSYTFGWADGQTYSFTDKKPETEIPEDLKEYLEKYLDIDNKPLFTFTKAAETVLGEVKTVGEDPKTVKKVVKKAVETE